MALSRTSVNNFSSLLIDNLVEVFELSKNSKLVFEGFPNSKEQLTFLAKLVQKATKGIEYWNEQELVIKYLSFIIDLADFTGSKYNIFAERNLTANIDNIKLAGKVDFVIAKGQTSPDKPYFFIQEYKRSRQNANSDPLAQLLGEMLVAAKLNEESVVYGAYIVGQFWYFVILNGREYNVLPPLDSAILEDLEVIMSKLNWIKKYVEEKVK